MLMQCVESASMEVVGPSRLSVGAFSSSFVWPGRAESMCVVSTSLFQVRSRRAQCSLCAFPWVGYVSSNQLRGV